MAVSSSVVTSTYRSGTVRCCQQGVDFGAVEKCGQGSVASLLGHSEDVLNQGRVLWVTKCRESRNTPISGTSRSSN